MISVIMTKTLWIFCPMENIMSDLNKKKKLNAWFYNENEKNLLAENIIVKSSK